MKLFKKPRTRRYRLVRNLLLTAAVLLLVYVGLGFPCFTPEAAFRRLERGVFLTPSTPVHCAVLREDDPPTRLVIGQTPDHFVLGRVSGSLIWYGSVNSVYRMPRAEGPSLLALPGDYSIRGGEPIPANNLRLVLLHAPPRAARAALTLTLADEGTYGNAAERIPTAVYHIAAERAADGAFSFLLVGRPYGEDAEAYQELTLFQTLSEVGHAARYDKIVRGTGEIRLYDAAGVFLSDLRLTVPEIYGA